MRIGPYALPNSLAVAPMAGVTDRPFRQLCKRLGAGYAVSEMVASNPALRGTAKSLRRIDHAGEVAPIAVQIAGADPDQLQAQLYVFAADGVVGGATARVHLRFTGVRSGGALVGITVHGDVALTRDQARWRIFGCDLDRMVQAR